MRREVLFVQKIKIYNKSDWLTRKYEEWLLAKKGFVPVMEEEIQKYSGTKGALLFILFPPLALLGFSKKIKVTYEQQEKIESK